MSTTLIHATPDERAYLQRGVAHAMKNKSGPPFVQACKLGLALAEDPIYLTAPQVYDLTLMVEAALDASADDLPSGRPQPAHLQAAAAYRLITRSSVGQK